MIAGAFKCTVLYSTLREVSCSLNSNLRHRLSSHDTLLHSLPVPDTRVGCLNSGVERKLPGGGWTEL